MTTVCISNIEVGIDNDNTNNCGISNGSTSSSSSETCENGGKREIEIVHDDGHFKLNIRILACIGALLPGVGCYLCLIYTYLFDFERVQNFKTPNCPHISSYFPPVSYSIGVWMPQKLIWLFILIIHIPARLFFGIIYKNMYKYGESEYKSRKWFGNIIKLHLVVLFLEISGLVSVSIFDMENNFKLHALSFCIWVISFDFNMLFNTMLQYYSGIRKLNKTLNNTFYVKCTVFMTAYPMSWALAFAYFIYLLTCNPLAYALFSFAEYFLVFTNSFFYFLIAWESEGYSIEIHVKEKQVLRKDSTCKTRL